MPTPITMPQLGESVAEGTIGRWLKNEGEMVKKDESLVEIITDKVNAELPSPFAGKLVKILVPVDATVKIGTQIALIEQDVDATATSTISAPAPSPAVPEPEPVAAHAHTNGSYAQHAETLTGERQHYSPLVRRMAQEHNINLELISGTGEGGRVRKEDVLAYLAQQQTAPQPVATTPAHVPAPSIPPATVQYSPQADEEIITPTPMRRAIAEHMVRSKHTSPHATTINEIDMTNLAKWLEKNKEDFKRREGYGITFLPFVMKATVEALRAFPMMNSSWINDQIILKKRIHLGVAISTGDGLVVPVVKNADEKSIAGLAKAVSELAAKARSNKLTIDDMQGSTFTVNNPGVFGTILSVPIINQPHAGILSMDAVVKRPVVTDEDAIAIRHMMYMCLSFDHRLVDGEVTARFMQHIRKHLEGYGKEISVY